MFGISTLLISLNESQQIPKQKREQRIKLNRKRTIKALFSGQFSGFITAVMPGLGAATAAVISMQVTRNLGDRGFMVLMGSISTVNFILSLATFYTIDKARNGSIIAVQKLIQALNLDYLLVFIATVVVACSISAWLALAIGSKFSVLISKVNYRRLVLAIIGFICLLAVILSGPLGILILLTSTAVGLLPAIKKTTRTHGMGCLILPTIFFFF
jgi:putative membrane protein